MITILFVILFAVALGFVQGLQTKDRIKNQINYDAKLSKQWHISQAVLHVLVALAVFVNAIPDFFSASFGFFMALSIIWTVFDLVHNKVAGLRAFHKGQNTIDKIISKVPVVVEILIKIILIMISTTYFLVNPYK